MPTHAGRSRGCRCATIAARWSARSWRASPAACATRSTWWAAGRWGAPRAAARGRTSGCGSWRACWSCHRSAGRGAGAAVWRGRVAPMWELRVGRVAGEEGAAYAAARLGGVAGGLGSDAGEAVAACVRTHGQVEPVDAWIEPYRELLTRYRA